MATGNSAIEINDNHVLLEPGSLTPAQPVQRSSFPVDAQPLFVPDEFDPRVGLVTPNFVLEPLGPQHNERDYAAWTSSMEHILATPGIVHPGTERPWPDPMTPDENLGDLVRHAEDFAARRGFTYKVLDPASNDLVGCLYIYPSKDDVHDARVKSWVTARRAELDHAVWRAVSDWLAAAWPFRNPEYAGRA